jgi:molecular chaperone DnaK (HSP70)
MYTILGVDFGTSNSCVSIFKDGRFKIIQNEYGKYTTPTCIYFNYTSNDILYGDLAFQQSDSRNGTLISNIKRLFGITFKNFEKSTTLKSFFKHLHIEKCKNSDYCCIVLQYNNQICRFTPHEISKMYLLWLLNTSESTIKNNIELQESKNNIELQESKNNIELQESKNNIELQESKNIIITVPVEFDNNQRLLLKKVLKNIGYNVIRILNEPTAATIGYASSENYEDIDSEIVLVIDCGGGTTDFTLLEADYSNMYFEVINTTGNSFLGGEDLTDNLSSYILSKINCDITSKITKSIKDACETCKQNLTYKTSDSVFLENIGDRDYKINVSRNIFESINNSWFSSFTSLLIEISDNQNIDKVILVGGTTRTPKIKSIIEEHLQKKICIELNPDHIVSIGAAYQGFLLNPSVDKKIDFTFVDTISMSLGIKTIGNIMTPIISKNTIIPCSHTETFLTTDSDTTIDIEVYQGERRFIKDNLLIGTFHINRSNNTSERLQITFDITSDGILIVTARNMDIPNEISVTFDNYIKDELNDKYTYSDDIDKINDMELCNLILAKIELSNTVKSRRSITENHVLNDQSKNLQYEKLINDAENTIDNYTCYTTEYLTEFKSKFEKTWNEIHFL